MTPAMLEDRSTDTAAERGARLHDEATRTIEQFLRGERVSPEVRQRITSAFAIAIFRAGLKSCAGAVACALVWAVDDAHHNPHVRTAMLEALSEFEDDAIEALAERMGNP